MPRRSIVLAAALALLCAVAPAARAVPFGADLNLPANVNFDCTVLPGPPPFGGGFTVLPSNAATCTWLNYGTVNNPAPARSWCRSAARSPASPCASGR